MLMSVFRHVRATLQPIFHKRIGADTFVSRMARLREDARFRAVGPETLVVDVVLDESGPSAAGAAGEDATDGEGEIWMDWAFVEFWKEHYCMFPPGCSPVYCSLTYSISDTIQKSITNDPDAAVAEVGEGHLGFCSFGARLTVGLIGGNIDAAALIASLRSQLQAQQSDIDRLQAKLTDMVKEREDEVR